VRLIDYYESSDEGLPHYAAVLKDKPYVYGQHWGPHDIQVREYTSGRSRIESAAALGLRFKIAPKHDIEDGIHAAKLLFPRCWFDEAKTRVGRDCLTHYRKRFNQSMQEFSATAVHDVYSHGADAYRGLAVRHKMPVQAKPAPSRPMPVRSRWG
jgi:hypothetical protein